MDTGPLEIAGVIFGLACVWLTAKQSIWCWPTGIVNILALMVIFYQSKLYPDVGLHVVYFFMSVYGWINWSRSTDGKKIVSVSRMGNDETLLWATITPYLIAGMGWMYQNYTDASVPYVDSGIVVVSLIANYLLCRKIFESWYLWILVDVVGVGLYLYKELYFISALYFVYLIICIRAMNLWKLELKRA